VLSKCANPACVASFRYLHQGRIFNIDVSAVSPEKYHIPKIERFWLCEQCAQVMKVVRENGVVSTRLLYLELGEGESKRIA
jgi:hypothetical protein